MKIFNLGSLAEFAPVGLGELLSFPVGDSGQRGVEFDVMATRPCEVWAVHGSPGDKTERAWPAAVGVGMMTVKFRIHEDAGVSFLSDDPKCEIFVRTRIATQVVASDGESFTTLEPARIGVSDEVRKVQALMAYNMRRMEAALERERSERVAAQAAAAAVVEPVAPVVSGDPA